MTTETHTAPVAPPLAPSLKVDRRTARVIRRSATPVIAALLTAAAATAVGAGITGRHVTGLSAERAATVAAVAAGPAAGSQTHLQELANSGLIPRQAIDTYRLGVERAVAGHLVPAAALVDPVDAYQQALEQAVNANQVPRAALDSTADAYDRRVNRAVDSHLIPPQAGEDR